ncbi:hypothetical protein HYT23_04295 [Candidatus Pacearchaeota archaeon]|nr:hypothetical protein [Candidatus Pacearchaeota archaeon]
MSKESKLKTPEWILEGYASEAEYLKKKGIKKSKAGGKVYRVKTCSKCGSGDVSVVLVGEEGKRADNWECHKCKWRGRDVKELELSEDEFLKRMEEQDDMQIL